jgi:hypothetical protein
VNPIVRKVQRQVRRQAKQEAAQIDPRYAAAYLIGRVHDADAALKDRILATRDLNRLVMEAA